ncbi:Rieske (2Fe-2S) protein [Saccharolobus islandicus]|uniref:Rieske (2Fe-2S) domain protein n=1 Tax=Saccharolobus islandicus (strain L.D.8.5 / Lassen \|nr:Rieske (2Fe-2S) protein [Sulfolobus islandicus]ADB86626.1 Rieske (2Fe-2S) domain protein [Sulfolobus islandicus L.D.8.5]
MLIRVCKISDLIDNKPMKFSVSKFEIVLIKIRDEVFTIEAYCPHKGANIEYGDVIAKEYRIRCHLHGYEFNLKDGRLVFKPYNRDGNWYYSNNLRVYKVKIINDDIFIDIDK